MANVVVLGLSGADGLWIVDLDAGTVIPMDEAPTGELANAASLRKVGDGFVKGVNFAMSVSTERETAAGFLEASVDVNDVAGGFLEASVDMNDVAGGFLEASVDMNDVAGGFLEADSAHK